uniref:Uncharacterized protein n=1 Tax=Anguilla anguilla TaxID=7936 RepID=A0A0E9PGI0_ANGAN
MENRQKIWRRRTST